MVDSWGERNYQAPALEALKQSDRSIYRVASVLDLQPAYAFLGHKEAVARMPAGGVLLAGSRVEPEQGFQVPGGRVGAEIGPPRRLPHRHVAAPVRHELDHGSLQAGRIVAAIDAADAAGPTTLDGCSAYTNVEEIAGRVVAECQQSGMIGWLNTSAEK